jgi:RNA polymerase sigma-70 factor (ECF subfamily)
MEQYSDEQLIIMAKKGRDTALDILIARYLKTVYNFALRYVSSNADAEDITQDTFVRVWTKLHKFDDTKTFKPWLYQITKNACLDFLKKKSAVPFSAFDTKEGNIILDTLSDTKPGPAESMENSLLNTKLTSSLSKLSPKLLEAITLHHTNELNFREISEQKGEPLHTIKSRYRRGILQLKKLLEPLI